MKRKTWLKSFVGSTLLVCGLSQAVLPEGYEQVPRVEFNCKGLRDVVFKENGDLTINGKTYRLEGGYQDTLFFNNKVSLIGDLNGDELLFDKSRIIYGGKAYRCTAE